MQEFENSQVESGEVGNEISMREFFSACLKHWVWFAVSIVVCAALALLYAKSKMQSYSSTAYILIKSSDGAGGNSAAAVFSDLGFTSPNNWYAVENEIYVLKSTQLMDEVVEKLRINNLYFVQRGLRKVNIYGKNPIEVQLESSIKYTKRPKEITVCPISETEYEYETDSISWTKAVYGEILKTEFGDVKVVKTPFFTDGSIDEPVYVNVNSVLDKQFLFVKYLK